MIARVLRLTLILSVSVLTAGTANGQATNDLTGVWLTDDGLGAVEFRSCGNKHCGRIVWLKSPLGSDGKPLYDGNNPDAAARKKPICGLEIVRDLRLQQDGSWDGGTIYDPKEGETYSVAVKVLRDGNLEVTGYMGMKAFGETMIWTKSSGNQPRCSTSG